MLHQLQALHGLDEELDRLLAQRETEDLPWWRRVLTRLLHRLSTTPDGLARETAWLAE
jgi:hypothetical protein